MMMTRGYSLLWASFPLLQTASPHERLGPCPSKTESRSSVYYGHVLYHTARTSGYLIVILLK